MIDRPAPTGSNRSKLFAKAALALLALLAVAATPAQAQVGGWLHFVGDPTHGYVQIPHHPELNPVNAVTIEAWIRFAPIAGCNSIVGKGWTQTYWLGVCGNTFRSYLKGSASIRDGGTIPANAWTHVAVTSDGTNRRHFINGVQVAIFAETGPFPANTQPVRIGSDVSWTFTPPGDIDEVRIWNVARSAAEIAGALHTAIQGGTRGLVAAWNLDGNADDSVGGHHASLGGAADDGDFQFPALPGGPFLTSPDLPDFLVKVLINGVTLGTEVADCEPETICVDGAVPNRAEVYVRVVGPKPNGYLWPHVIKFTTNRVEVWIQQISTGALRYYYLSGANPDFDRLPGIFDRTGFLP